MKPDGELLRAYAGEDSQEAFAELARRHVGLVFSAAVRRTGGNRALAEEVAQQVFIHLARHSSRLAGHPALSGWLYTATRNVAVNAVRAEQRRRAREKEASLMQTFSSKPAIESEADGIRPVLDKLLDRLSERERIALILRFFEGRPFSEIGLRLAISEDAARMRVERGLEKMRRGLKRVGIGSSTAALTSILAEEAALAAPEALIATVSRAGATVIMKPASVGFWQFMSTTKLSVGTAALLGLTALLSIPAVGIAEHEFEAGQRAEMELAQVSQNIMAKEREIGNLKKAADAAGRKQAEMRGEMDKIRLTLASGRSDSPGDRSLQGPRDPKVDGQKFLTAFPQARAMLAAAARAQIEGFYASFFHSAGLTPSQIEQFDNLITESWYQKLTVAPGSLGGFAYSDMIASEQLAQFLGASAIQQYQDFNQKVPAYILSNQIAATVGSVSTPLSANQMDELAEIVASNSPEYQTGGKVNVNTVDWNAVQDEAKTVVSASQWPATEAVLNSAQYQQALFQAQQASAAKSALGASAP